MTEHDHPVDDALRQIAGDPTPSEDDRRIGADRLARAIADEQRPRPWLSRRSTFGWAFALVIVLTGVFVMIEAISPTPTEAAIEEIAEAAEQAHPMTIPAQEFVYMRSEVIALMIVPREALEGVEYQKEFLVYLLPRIRETWFGSEGTVQIRTTSQTPIFFTDRDEAVYYQAGLDQQDDIGETATLITTDQPTARDWPRDSAELDGAIQEAAATDRGLPQTVEYLDVALDILREPLAPPELRSTTLRLIGQLPDLQIADTNPDGATTFGITYQAREVETRQTFTLSPRGHLLSEQTRLLESNPQFGIPADTVTFTALYGEPVVVDDLDHP